MARLNKNYLEGVGGAAVEVEGSVEKVVATVEGVTTDITQREIFILADFYWEAAATAEHMECRIRRGLTAAGTEVAKMKVDSVVSKLNEGTLQARDILGECAGQAYCITMVESKAAAKDKAIECRIRVEF